MKQPVLDIDHNGTPIRLTFKKGSKNQPSHRIDVRIGAEHWKGENFTTAEITAGTKVTALINAAKAEAEDRVFPNALKNALGNLGFDVGNAKQPK